MNRPRTALQTWQLHYGPNMTPMVDVVMVILIFFMASAAIIGPSWFLRTALPPEGAAGATAEDQLVRLRVRIGAGGGVEAAASNLPPEVASPGAGSIGDFERWAADLAARVGPERVVVLIEPAAEAAYEDVVRLHEAMHRLGIGKVGLAPVE